MEIKGKIIQALPEVSGVSRSGNPWKKKEYILETIDGAFPRKVHFTCFGDNADKIVLAVGQTATVSFDIESREFNGRWYTDIRAWKAEVEQPEAAHRVQATPFQGGAAVPPPPVVANPSDEEEFPF